MTTSAVVLGLVAASVGRIVSLVSSIRSCLREGRKDGQRENERSDEDGLAKNVSSRRVSELEIVFHNVLHSDFKFSPVISDSRREQVSVKTE